MFIQALLSRLRTGNVTQDYPLAAPPPAPPAAYIGLPILQIECCQHCGTCTQVCPTQALQNGWRLDRGKCIACGACIDACPNQAIVASGRYDAAVTVRHDLVLLLQDEVQPTEEKEEVRSVVA